jgi:hypothetical protein
MSKIVCTLDPNRCDSHILLSQGNLVITNDAIVDYNRKVMGTLAFAAGTIAFEGYFWSNSRPANGLANLCSIGVASVRCPINGTNAYVGGDTVAGQIASCGLRPSDGTGSATGAGMYMNNTLQGSAFNTIGERQCIGVMLVNDPVTPIVAFQVDNNYLGQVTLPAGLFYVPAISIGCSASAGDVNAYVNFGQYRLDYPTMLVNN